MSIPLLLQTIRFLKPLQVWHQLRHKVYRPRLKVVPYLSSTYAKKITSPIVKPCCLKGNQFTFLNISDEFRDWQMPEHGALWTYNLNYMDWLGQDGLDEEVALAWIDRFIRDLPANRVGQDPYPTALRLVNWAKFFTLNPALRTSHRMDSMHAQLQQLQHSIEYHVLGNHLLEDAYALFICAVFFCNQSLYIKAKKLLLCQLNEQILPDGAHYEQSPMYHCILLDRLLDCINFSTNNPFFEGQTTCDEQLKHYAKNMLGHLAVIVYSDGSIPLLNDSANGIAPSASQLFDYARHFGLDWSAIPLRECGYRKFCAESCEVIADVGNIAASYQPGHSHADTFTFELLFEGLPVFVDTGVSTYNKNSRRQYERGTAAHNTVTVGGRNSSQVWGGFRMGNRAKVHILKDAQDEVCAQHNGFGRGKWHRRHFKMLSDSFLIEDWLTNVSTEGLAYFHIAPGLNVEEVCTGSLKVGNLNVLFEGQDSLEIQQDFVSSEYNQLNQCAVVVVHFKSMLQTRIQLS